VRCRRPAALSHAMSGRFAKKERMMRVESGRALHGSFAEEGALLLLWAWAC
jgi:hypothetical protein